MCVCAEYMYLCVCVAKGERTRQTIQTQGKAKTVSLTVEMGKRDEMRKGNCVSGVSFETATDWAHTLHTHTP